MSAARRRLVVIHSSDEMYGADRMVLQMVAALDAFEVEVWLPNDLEHSQFPLCDELDARGVEYHHVSLPVLRRSALRPGSWARLGGAMWSTYRRLRRVRPDGVLLASSACLLAAPIASMAGIEHRVVYVQERWSGRSATVLRVLAAATTSRIAISAFVAASTGLRRPKPTVVVNAVPDRSQDAPPVSVPTDRIRAVVASRWNWWKGHQTLLRAWDLAGCPGVLTVLGGPAPSGPSVDVKALAANVSDPTSVRIVGEVPDIAPYVQAANLLILPSDEPEPFGLVVAEAFSLGRAVVASDAGGPREIISDGTTGWLFSRGDADALAKILRDLDPQVLAAAGATARAEYLQRFAGERYRREIAAAIGEAMSS